VKTRKWGRRESNPRPLECDSRDDCHARQQGTREADEIEVPRPAICSVLSRFGMSTRTNPGQSRHLPRDGFGSLRRQSWVQELGVPETQVSGTYPRPKLRVTTISVRERWYRGTWRRSLPAFAAILDLLSCRPERGFEPTGDRLGNCCTLPSSTASLARGLPPVRRKDCTLETVGS